MISKPSAFAFDVAVSSAEYDTRVLREIERQLTLRLPSMPPLRPVWTSAAAERLNAPRASVFGKSARIVVVLHQHLWGTEAPTQEDAASIKRRMKPVSQSRAIPKPVNTPANAADCSSTNTNWNAV